MDLFNKLQSNPKNPRKISKSELANLTEKIKEFPEMLVKRPVVYDSSDNFIILGGNKRSEAIRILIEKGEIELKPEYFADAADWTPEKKRKFVILDNISDGQWDMDILKNDWSDLPLQKWGIQQAMWPTEEKKEDHLPQLPEEAPQSEKGEVYQLGNHRLMCGDATSDSDVKALMGDQKAELLFTSPPYSDMREYSGEGDLNLSTTHLALFLPTFKPYAAFQAVNLGMQRKENEIYPYWNDYIVAAKNNGLKLLSWNIWNREGCGFTLAQISAMFAIQHEWILVFGEKPKDLNLTVPNKDAGEINDHSWNRQADGSTTKGKTFAVRSHRQLGTINSINSEQSREWTKKHPAMFPVRLPSMYIEAMTKEGDNVIDCFGGAGTTLIAAEQLKRNCFMLEIDPRYCDVIRQRYAKLIGKEQEWQTATPKI